MAKSNQSARERKASSQSDWKKPYPDFPLSYHSASGRLYKKIRGRRVYFGYGRDWQKALEKYQNEKDDLYAGRTPRKKDGRLTLLDLSDHFMEFKEHTVDTGELTERSFRDYRKTCEKLLTILGKNIVVAEIRPDDLLRVREKLASTLGPVSLANEIGRVRVLFNFAYENELIEKPIRFGKSFKKPSKRVLRQHKAKREAANGKRFFTADEIRSICDTADVHLRAMVLLGINCGFGNADCGQLPTTAIDLDGGWIDFPRPKTGIARRCPLWPSTIEALRESLAQRQVPKEKKHDGLVFITKYGKPWFKKDSSTNPVSQQFRKLLIALGVHRHGVGFYALRHTFETVAGGTKDQVAVNHIMGHIDDTMADEYREHIADERLRNVTDHVRAWLFPETSEGSDQGDIQAASGDDRQERPRFRVVG